MSFSNVTRQQGEKYVCKDRPPIQQSTICGIRIAIPPSEEPRPKTGRRKSASPEKPCVLSEDQLREEAAWKQVWETGKPVEFEGKWLIPDGMSAWEAIEFLPDDIKEQARSGLQKHMREVVDYFIQQALDEIRDLAIKRSETEPHEALPLGARLAIAESVVRQRLGLPEIPLEELLDRRMEHTKKRTKRTKKR